MNRKKDYTLIPDIVCIGFLTQIAFQSVTLMMLANNASAMTVTHSIATLVGTGLI